MSVTLTFEACGRIVRAAALGAAVALVSLANSARAEEVQFASTAAALEQGINAFRGRYMEIALPALRFAAKQGAFRAQVLLATIVSDNDSNYTNHAEAFRLFKDIADRHAGIDPDDDPRAPYVSNALLSTANYLVKGVREAGQPPHPRLARVYLEHAANMFANLEAQFELAKLLLVGEGGPKDIPKAIADLRALAHAHHPGAQATYARLLWRGEHVKADPARALAWAEMAVKGASARDQLWIDEYYHEIYCNSGSESRGAAGPLVQMWERLFGETRARREQRMGIGLVVKRTCHPDGRPVPLLQALRGPPVAEAAPATAQPPGGTLPAPTLPPREPLLEVSRPGQ